ncbi:hypothetical protein BHE74_00048758 [Ensete ventricosum]|nr:hypothetical protein BHE74_00048758 [Ensete ventricosum]
MSARLSRTIYVGNLPIDIRESEVEDLFYKYGHIVEIQLKNPPRPPGYCFVEFYNPNCFLFSLKVHEMLKMQSGVAMATTLMGTVLGY